MELPSKTSLANAAARAAALATVSAPVMPASSPRSRLLADSAMTHPASWRPDAVTTSTTTRHR